MSDSALTRAIRRRYEQNGVGVQTGTGMQTGLPDTSTSMTRPETPAPGPTMVTETKTTTSSQPVTANVAASPLTRAIQRRYSQQNTTPATTDVNRMEYDNIKQAYVSKVLTPQLKSKNSIIGKVGENTLFAVDWKNIPDEYVPTIRTELNIVTDLEQQIERAKSPSKTLEYARNNGLVAKMPTPEEVYALEEKLALYLSDPETLKADAAKRTYNEKKAAEYQQAGAESVNGKGTVGRWAVNLGTNFAKGIADAGVVDTLRAVAAVEELVTPKKETTIPTGLKGAAEPKTATRYAVDTYDHMMENYMAGMNSQLSGVEQTAGQAAQMAGGMVPTVLISMVTAGGSAAAQAADAATDVASATTKMGKVAGWLQRHTFSLDDAVGMMKNPTFWTSAVPTYGRSHDDAKKAGASEAQAQLYGLLNGFAGAAIEVGGGVQTLPGTQSGIRQIVKSALEEGGEEVLQGLTEGVLKKAVFDQDKEWYSWTDPNAVINPERMATEFGWGALMGGVVSGGKVAVETAVQNVARYSNALQVGTQILNGESGATLQDAIALGMNTPKGSDTYIAAQNIQSKAEAGKSVSAYAVGRMVMESQTDTVRHGTAIQNSVMESAKAVNIKPEVAETVSAAAVQMKQRVVFAAKDSTLVAQKRAGAYNPKTDTVVLNPMVSQQAMLGYVMTHEMTHSAEGTRQLETLSKTVRRMVGDAGWQSLLADTKAGYAAAGVELNDTQVEKEALANWMGQNLFKDGFAQAVVNGDATTGGFFLQTIDRVRRATMSQKNNPSASDVAMLERLFMQAVENKQGSRNGDVEYAINADFVSQYDQWDGKNPRITFVVGTTSEVLQKLGLSEQAITWDAAKIIKIKNKHPEMTDEIIKKVPEVLENPIVVMESLQSSSRWTMFGELYSDTEPILVVLELNPKGRNGVELDELKVVSSYSKNNAQNFIDNSTILYVSNDKKRNSNWKKRTGLQLPVGLSITDPNTTVAQNADGVNTQSMQGRENYSQFALLPETEFTGDAMMIGDTLPVAADIADVTAAPVNEAQVLERAVETTAQGRVVARSTNVEGVIAELGDDVALRRMYNAAQLIRPTGRVNIDGQTVDADAYMDAFEQSLPEDPAALRQEIRRLEHLQAEELIRQHQEGDTEETSSTALKLNLQLFAAHRKWDLLQLDPGEDGKKARRFYENRLKGNDILHNEELAELLAGRSETYNAICNQKTLDRANSKLRDDTKYRQKLLQRIGRMDHNDRFGAVDVAAATVLIKDAYNDGEYGVMVDLISGLSRKGTELGRAVQAFSMMARMTPEGTLKAAKRSLKADADYVIGEGADEGLDVLADDISGALSRLARLKGEHTAPTESGHTSTQGEGRAVWDGTVGEGTPSMEGASREQIVDALADDLAATEGTYLTREDIAENLNKIIQDATDVPEQVKRYVLKKLRKGDGGLAQRLYEMHQKGHLTADSTRRAMEEALELPTLSDNDVKTLVEMATKAQELAEDPVAQAEAMDEIYDFLGAKMTVKGLDTLQAWRKFAMLANVKTHVRNTVSNAAYGLVRKADELVAMGLEKMFRVKPENRGAYLGWSHTEHGQSIMPLLQERAKTAVLEMQQRGAKYETGTGQLKSRRNFFGESKVGEALNKANTWNSAMLEKEDVWFFEPAYIDALGQMMTAQGSKEITPQMHERAMQRALEATFRADNAISEVVSSLKRHQNSSKAGLRLFGQAVDVVIPFHKTPANIATQTVMHSPVGIVKGAFDLWNATKGKGSKDVATAINTMAKGLTGSALLAIGVLLGNAGLFNTGFGKTEKERAADELAGIQQNAFILGDTSVTMDWLQPAASPLVIGASMGQRIKEEGMDIGAVFGAVMDGTDSLFEMSMLQSLYDVLGGYDAGATATAASVAENVVSQSVPTLLGQLARSIDPVQRKTTGDSDFETILNQVVAKIPGLTYFLDPELDVWGNEVYRTGKPSTGNAVLNAAQQFVIPWNTKQGTGADDPLTEELLRIYEIMDTGAVIPTAITRDDAKDHGVDYVEINRTLGGVNRQALDDFINNRWPYTVQVTLPNGKTRNVTKYYSEMTDDERRRVLSRIYQKSKGMALSEEDEGTAKKSREDRYFEEIFRRLE